MADWDALLNGSGPGSMVSDDLIQPNLVNASMQECLARANTDQRLVAGFKDVIDCLEKRSAEALFCILPENLWNDSGRKAVFNLVMSLCYSHQVKMIKVDDDQLVRKIIDRTSGRQSHGHLSYECMLVLQSRPDPAQQLQCDLQLLRYHGKFSSVDFQNLPLVRLSEY